MSLKTAYTLKALQVLSWIIFVGLCVEAGGFITNSIATLMLSPEGSGKFWKEVDLSALYHFNQSHYVVLTSLMIIATVLKALMFYFIVKIFHDKELNLSKPFNEVMKRFILVIAYLALGIGLFSFWGTKFAAQLVNLGVPLPDIQQLRFGGADVWLFMGVTLLVIAYIFQKGIDIQNENDLTV
jgi:Protein of unknown function (DUF2975)